MIKLTVAGRTSGVLLLGTLLFFFGGCGGVKPKPVKKVQVAKPKGADTSFLMENLWGLPPLAPRDPEADAPLSNLENEEWMEAFQSERSPAKAYEKLKGLMARTDPTDYHALFESFSRAAAFQKYRRGGKDIEHFIQQWSRDALRAGPDVQRFYYSSFYHRVRHTGIRWIRFRTTNNLLQPGDTLEVRSVQQFITQKPKDKYNIRVERKVAGEKGTSYRSVANGPLGRVKGRYGFRKPLTEPGTYRISIYNSHFFQQLVVLVTGLNALVKSDSATLALWAYSRDPNLKPPYDVTVYFDARNKVDVQTDSTGLVALLRSPEDKTDSLRYQAVIRKGSHRAYVEGEWGGSSQGQSPLFLNVTSNREAYQPGDTLRYYALWRWNNGFNPLPPGFNDSLRVEFVGGAALLGQRVEVPDALGIVEGFIPIPASTGGRYQLRFSHRGRVLWEKPVMVVSPHQGGLEIQAPQTLWGEGDTVRLLVSNPSGATDPRVVIRTEVRALEPDSPESFTQFQDTLELSPAGRGEWKKVIPFYANAQTVSFQVFEMGSKTPDAEENGIQAKVDSWCRVQWQPRTRGTAIQGKVRCLGLGNGPGKEEGDLYLEVYPESGDGVRLPLTPSGSGLYAFELPELTPGSYRAMVVDAQRVPFSSFYPVEIEEQGLSAVGSAGFVVTFLNGPFRQGDTARVHVRAAPGSRVLVTLEDGKIRKMRGASLISGEHFFEIPMRFQGEAKLSWVIVSGEGRDEGYLPVPVRPPRNHPDLRMQIPVSVVAGDTVPLRIRVTAGPGNSPDDSLDRGVPAAFQVKVIPLKSFSQLDTAKTLPGNHARVAKKKAVHSGLTSEGAALLQLDRPLPDAGDKPSLAATYRTISEPSFEEEPVTAGWQEVSEDVRWISGRVPGNGEITVPVVIPSSSEWCLVQLRGAAASGTFFSNKVLSVRVPPEIRWEMPAKILEGESVSAHTVLRGQTNGQPLSLRVSLATGGGSGIWDSTAVLTGTPVSSQTWALPSLELKPGKYRLTAEVEPAGSMKTKEMKAKELKATVITRPFTFAVVPKDPESRLEYSGAVLSGMEESSNYFQLNFNKDKNGAHPQGGHFLKDTIALNLYGNVKGLARDALESALGDWPHHYLSRVSFFLGLVAIRGDDGNAAGERRSLGKEVLLLLSRHQNTDGGWSWERGASDLLWTVWCGRALTALKSVEPELWDTEAEKMLARACDKIRGLLVREKDDNALAYGVRFLTRAGKKKNLHNYVLRLEREAARLSAPALIFLWETLLLVKADPKRTDALGALLKQKAFAMPSEISFGGDARSPWFGSGFETTAHALWLFARWDLESSGKLRKMVTYLCRNRTREHWGTLKSTVVVAEALAMWWDNQFTGAGPEPYTGKVFFNGAKIYEFDAPSDTSRSLSLKIPLPRDSVKNRIVLGFAGKGAMFYGASIPTASPEPAPGPGRELSVERTLHRLKYRPSGVGGSGGWRVIREPWSGGALRAGEELEVRLTVRGFREHRDLLVNQAVPTTMTGLHKSPQWYRRWLPGEAGFLPMKSEEGFFRARLPRLEGREATFRFVLRAEEGGRVYLPPARVQSFMNPSLSHRTESAWIHMKEDRP